MAGAIKTGAVRRNGGIMKITTKIAALAIVAAFATAPAMAAPRHKKKDMIPMDPHKMTSEQAMAYNKRNLSLIVQGLPLVLPTWSLPIYFKMQEHADQEKHGKRKRH